jgi:hypothetical protein
MRFRLKRFVYKATPVIIAVLAGFLQGCVNARENELARKYEDAGHSRWVALRMAEQDLAREQEAEAAKQAALAARSGAPPATVTMTAPHEPPHIDIKPNAPEKCN